MSNSADALPDLLPRPRHFEIHAGSFRLHDGTPIVLDETATDADFASACALRDALLRTHELRLPVETHARHDDLGPRIELRREVEAGEAYRLRIDGEHVQAIAAGA